MSERAELLAVAIAAARATGRYLEDLEHVEVSSEKGKDIELQADVKAQEIIFSYLEETGYPIVSEHAALPRFFQDEMRWIVDPLDGSLNFYRRVPLAAVSIALWRGNESLVGVVYDFSRDDMYSAIVGESAHCNGELIYPSSIAEKDKAILCTGFPSRGDYSSEGLTNVVKAVQEFKKVRLLGSAAISLAYVACGKADAYQEKGIMIWDVAAGLALVQAAGGRFTMEHVRGSQCDVFSSNGHF